MCSAQNEPPGFLPETPTDSTPTVIIVLKPGIYAIGPFPGPDVAAAWAGSHLVTDRCLILDLQYPEVWVAPEVPADPPPEPQQELPLC